MSKRVGLSLVVVTLITFAVGCGGGSSNNNNTNTSTNPPTIQPAAQNGCSNSTALTAGNGTATCGITASGGQGPYTWTVNNTACQTTLTVFDTGTGLGCTVSGAGNSNLGIQPLSSAASGRSAAVSSARSRVMPMASSTSVNVPVNVMVTGANGKSSTLPSFTITVTIKALGISSTSLPNGTVGVAYSTSVSGSGGVPPYTWTITGLPAGLTSTGAQISGTPTQSGTFTIAVRINDSEASRVSVQVTLILTISPASSSPLMITTTSPLPGGKLGSAYPSTSITATGGTAPYTFSVASGSSLPSGLTFTSGSPSATISGTPTATGTFSFTVDVQDSAISPATAHATFMLTITGSSTFTCPSPVNLTLCGTYTMGLAGAKGSQGFVAFGIVIVVDNSGHVIKGEGESNDSVSGDTKIAITGGSYSMDSSGDGRGLLTVIDSTAATRTFRFVVESATNGPGANIVEFDNTGVIAEGDLEGPETFTNGSSANLFVSVPIEGVNANNQRAALFGVFQTGSAGCDGSNGSLASIPNEPIVTSTAGTVATSLIATGLCSAPDSMGVGTLQITLSGGTPFTNNTLHFASFYVEVSGSLLGAFLLETDPIGSNQPILAGVATAGPIGSVGGVTASSVQSGCAPGCLLSNVGTTNGTIAAHTGIASIVRFTATASTTTMGTLSGVIDKNAAGTITSNAAWPYTSFTVDNYGVGTFSGPGQPTIHFIEGGDGTHTLDESSQVMTGNIRPQNLNSPYSIESPGQPYIVINTARTLGDVGLSGVLIPSGTTSGNFSGAFDLVSEAADTADFMPGGSYTSISGTTGRSTGTANMVNTSTGNIVIYAFRHRVFLVLDMQSTDPYLIEGHLQ
jgi:putative Ig domain-containing protein